MKNHERSRYCIFLMRTSMVHSCKNYRELCCFFQILFIFFQKLYFAKDADILRIEEIYMEENIWKTLYERAKAVQCERKLSPLMEVGSVGAAILTDNGSIYTGICIDTACGMGMCAERNAIANMLTNGESRILKVVAVMPDGSSGTPCGVCREFMMQLGKESAEIEILLSLEPLKTVKLGEQLPDWWGSRFA